MKNYFYIFSFLFGLLFMQYSLTGQQAASLNCLEVGENGEVILYWTPTTDPTGFEKYEIYFSEDGLSFTLEGSITNISENHEKCLSVEETYMSRR